MQKQGIAFNTPALDDMPKWRAATDRAIDQLGKEGAYSIELLNQIRQLLVEFRETEEYAAPVN